MTIRCVLFSALILSLAACAQNEPAPPPANPQPSASNAATTPSGSAEPARPDTPPPAATAEAEAAAPRSSSAGAQQPTGAAGEKPAASATTRLAEAATPAAAPKPLPEFREITIPAGTAVNVRLTTPVASDTSHVEEEVRGALTAPIVVDGVTVVPADAEIVGTVREARRSGRVKGLASIAFRFERLRVRSESHAIRTASVRREAAPDRKDDVKKGAIGGAAGAIVGGIAAGGKGAAIGAAVGGAGAVMATRGDEVRLPAGTTVRTTLQEPLKVLVPLGKSDR